MEKNQRSRRDEAHPVTKSNRIDPLTRDSALVMCGSLHGLRFGEQLPSYEATYYLLLLTSFRRQ